MLVASSSWSYSQFLACEYNFDWFNVDDGIRLLRYWDSPERASVEDLLRPKNHWRCQKKQSTFFVPRVKGLQRWDSFLDSVLAIALALIFAPVRRSFARAFDETMSSTEPRCCLKLGRLLLVTSQILEMRHYNRHRKYYFAVVYNFLFLFCYLSRKFWFLSRNESVLMSDNTSIQFLANDIA